MLSSSSPVTVAPRPSEVPRRLAEFSRELALVRSPGEPAERRAFAATMLAAGEPARPGAGSSDAALRMFGFETRHDDALQWDGRSARSGTITYLDHERVEQYIGRQQWIAYRRSQLGAFANTVGDVVRVVPRGPAAIVETTGPNRFAESMASVLEVRSGMRLVRTTPIGHDELEVFARAIAERYGAAASSGSDGEIIEFKSGAARLTLAPEDLRPGELRIASALLSLPASAAAHLTVTARSNRLDAALDAERALMLCAAMVGSEAESIAIDDSGAVFSADELYDLGTGDAMRADAFAFAAAAVGRALPAQTVWFSRRSGECDELVVLSNRPWQADFAAALLERELAALTQAGRSTGDPVVPFTSYCFAGDPGADPGEPVLLATMTYETVVIEVEFMNAEAATGELRAAIDARSDVAALLGAPIASAIVIAFGNAGDDAESDRFALEMRRAETLVTALGAAFAQCGDAIAADVRGTLYDARGLLELARRRAGKSSAWSARVATLAPGADAAGLAL